MTTTVTILIAGNKACETKVIEADGSDSTAYPSKEVKPQGFRVVGIHGEQKVSVVETGPFLN